MSKQEYLLDSSVLIALLSFRHEFHERVTEWLGSSERIVCTCPITEGAVARCFLREPNVKFEDVQESLRSLASQPTHRFIPDDLSYAKLVPTGIVGHRQVTDAYLAQLARHHGVRLATLDRAQAVLFPDVAELVIEA